MDSEPPPKAHQAELSRYDACPQGRCLGPTWLEHGTVESTAAPVKHGRRSPTAAFEARGLAVLLRTSALRTGSSASWASSEPQPGAWLGRDSGSAGGVGGSERRAGYQPCMGADGAPGRCASGSPAALRTRASLVDAGPRAGPRGSCSCRGAPWPSCRGPTQEGEQEGTVPSSLAGVGHTGGFSSFPARPLSFC